MNIRIEDEFVDIISKARAGLRLSQADLAEQTGLDVQIIRDIFKGNEYDEYAARKIANALQLSDDALVDAHPAPADPMVTAPEGLLTINTPFPMPGYEEMTVNAYILHNPGAQAAIAFDGGAVAQPFIDAVKENELALEGVFLTHSHRDHIEALAEIFTDLSKAPLFAHQAESPRAAESFAPPAKWELAGLAVEAFETKGHSPGGTSYFVTGLETPIAIVGDAIFCGSIGGVRGDYQSALEQIRNHILSLPDETILCPGHGPLTTVAHEKKQNPFFA